MYKLIIIDDEEKILDGMAKLFPWENIGFQVVGQFMHAGKALEFIDSNEVDVVLSDIEMPDISGIELSKELLKRGKIKTLLFSSYQNYDYFRAAIQNEVSDYLLKPIEYEKLFESFERIKSILDKEKKVVVTVPKSYYSKIIYDVNEYLNECYQHATLEEAAIKVNLSPTYLSKIYKDKSGSSFSDMLLKIRMEKACEMLEDIQYKGYEIAYYVGYDNPKNFSRAFKAYYQVSPSEYRYQKLEGNETL